MNGGHKAWLIHVPGRLNACPTNAGRSRCPAVSRIKEAKGTKNACTSERTTSHRTRWLAVQFAAQHGLTAPLKAAPLDDAAVERALARLATGLKSFAELESAARGAGLLRAIEQRMPPGTRRLLEEIAPAAIRLPRGRHLPVHYEPNQPPWIASRLQDFFGMRETPTVGRGAVPVVAR